MEAVHAGLFEARGDVVGTRGYGAFEGQYVCVCNAFDVVVVAGLFPAAVYPCGPCARRVSAS